MEELRKECWNTSFLRPDEGGLLEGKTPKDATELHLRGGSKNRLESATERSRGIPERIPGV
jgi:hypothetical protein